MSNTEQFDELLNPEAGLNVLNDIRLRTFIDGMSKRGYDIQSEDELMKLYNLGEVLAEKEASAPQASGSLSDLADAALAAEGAQKAAEAPEEGLPADIQEQLVKLAQQPQVYLPALSYATAALQAQEGN